MANQSIYNAFERMWQHITTALNNKSDIAYVDSLTKIYAQPDEPNTPKEGDVWIDTDEEAVGYAEGESF